MLADRSNKRKVLIVSQGFPPANTPGAVRVSKLAKYLPDFGWEPVVLTVDRVRGVPQNLPVEVTQENIFRTPYFNLDFTSAIRHRLVGNESVSSDGRPAGDRNVGNIPESEREVCQKYGIKVINNVGEKVQSSSWLLKNIIEKA